MIAKDRLKELDDGRFNYEFKRTWKSGAKGIYFEGPDFQERLAALIPPPLEHQLRSHGVYAPNSRFQAVVKRITAQSESALHRSARERCRTYWVLWAALLKRTFKAALWSIDVWTVAISRLGDFNNPLLLCLGDSNNPLVPCLTSPSCKVEQGSANRQVCLPRTVIFRLLQNHLCWMFRSWTISEGTLKIEVWASLM